MRKTLRWLGRGVLGLAAVLALAASGIWLWWRSGLPQLDGTVDLPGLEAPVTVARDRNAVPHIFAASEGDVYFALGFVHAQDRLWQMDLQRRAGAGRLAELFGARALRSDRLVRTLGLYRRAQASYAALAPEVRTALDRYADGVNAWLAGRNGALPPEFTLLWYEPEPWHPADSLVWGQLMALRLSFNANGEVLRARLTRRLGPERTADLFPPFTASAVDAPPPAARPAPAESVPAEDLGRRGDAGGAEALRLAALLPGLAAPGASNEWALAGSRTVTGRPILANDPHLQLGAPALWYLVRMEAPTLSVAGATVPGVPFVLLGHNAAVAWGSTISGIDVQDLFVERLDPADPGRYLTPEGSAPFEQHTETIAVAGDAPETLTVRSTRHGPVISDLDPDLRALAGDGQVLALAFTALAAPGVEPAADTTAEAVYRFNHAADATALREAARLWRAPSQNLLYADHAGTIGIIAVGLVPVRARGDGRMPVPGWTGEHDWAGVIPFDDLPQRVDPPSGRLLNANEPLAAPDYPHALGEPYEEGLRAARIAEMLDAGGRHGLADSVALQSDTVSMAARALLPLLLAVRTADGRASQALDRLRQWDFRAGRDRPEPLIFTAWLREIDRALFAAPLGGLFDDYWGLRPRVVRHVLTAAPEWCGRSQVAPAPGTLAEACQDVLRRALDAALDDLATRYGNDMAAWQWGRAHVAPLAHPLFSRVPVLDRLFDIGIAADGDQFSLNRGGTDVANPEAPFADIHAAGFRAVYDLDDPARSRFIIATGQSGHPLSPHYGDLVERWRDGETITLSGTAAELARTGLGTLTLRPPPTPPTPPP